MLDTESTCLPLSSSEKHVKELDQRFGLLDYMFLTVVEEKILLPEFLAMQSFISLSPSLIVFKR